MIRRKYKPGRLHQSEDGMIPQYRLHTYGLTALQCKTGSNSYICYRKIQTLSPSPTVKEQSGNTFGGNCIERCPVSIFTMAEGLAQDLQDKLKVTDTDKKVTEKQGEKFIIQMASEFCHHKATMDKFFKWKFPQKKSFFHQPLFSRRLP